jgi:L-lactate dehydrogenase complex protein LldE
MAVPSKTLNYGKPNPRGAMTAKINNQPIVGLFVTCAVDLFRPSVGFAAVQLLENAGCRVVVPPQGCCGQVGYNNGLSEDTQQLAHSVIDAFAGVDYIVAPSGSCASMLKNHYPELFRDSEQFLEATRFAAKVYELTQFLADILQVAPISPTAKEGKNIAYHDSCAGLRELGIHRQPRTLALGYQNATFNDIPNADVCCGFGGTFCTKFEDIANKMVADKAANILAVNPDLLLGGDLPCLLNIAGYLRRQGHHQPEVRHIAEFLAGSTDQPGIGREK